MLAIRLFGRPRLSNSDREWEFASSRKTIPLLAYLVTRQEAPIAREYLATLLWPDEAEEPARANLRRHLHLLSKALPPDVHGVPYVLNTQHTTRWNPRAPAVADVIEFKRACAQPELLERAADLYGGPFLEEFYDEWIVAERERLLEMQIENLRKLVRRKRGERNFEGALADVARILALDPWREDAVRAELALRDALGDRSGALAAYRAFAARLRADLDTDPMPETRAAYDALLRDLGPADGAYAAHDGTSPAAARLPQERGLPFRGREDSLAILVRAWTAAAQGQGSFSLVGGEAGIGKSRLVAELSLLAEAQGARIFMGATPPQESVPHAALADCLRAAATLLEESLPATTLQLLGRLVPIFAAPGPQPLPPVEAERFALFEAVCEAVAELAKTRPVLIVLEDLHWAGNATFALLEFLTLRLAKRPIAFVATYRADEIERSHPLRPFRRRLERDSSYAHVALERLSRETIAGIAREVRPDAGDTFEAVVDALYAGSEGVPLFLEAALRDGASSFAGDGPLRIEARLARLKPEAVHVLEVASIAGSGFDLEVMREILGWREAEILGAIDSLIAAYLIREPYRSRRNDFAFTHHLVRDAVYARIDERERSRRHAALAVVLAELYPESYEDNAAAIALHWHAGNRLPEAARAYAVAAKRSAALYAYDEARTFASRALALAASDDLRCEMYLLHESASDKLADRDAQDRDLTALAEIAPRTIYEIDYVLARVRVAMYRARYEEAEEMLARAKVAVPPADARRRGEIRVFEAELLYHRGAFVAAKAMMEATIASFEQSGQDLGTLHALDTFLNMAMSSLDLPLVMAYGRRMLAHAERIGAIDRQACAHEKLGAALQRLGSIPEALEHLETARALYARVGDVPAARVAAYGMATVQIMQGRYDIARTLFASGLADIADLQNAAALAAARNNLAATELLMGDLEAAARIARQALEEFGDARGGHYVQLLLILAVSLHYLGRSDEAIAVARTAAGAARPYGDSDTLAESLLQCLLMSLCRGELGEARALRDELLNMSEKTRDASLFPECFPWILASVADCDSDVEGAKVLRQQALTLFAAHQERLPPEGRELYRRVVWIAPMAGAHTSDAWRTPSP